MHDCFTHSKITAFRPEFKLNHGSWKLNTNRPEALEEVCLLVFAGSACSHRSPSGFSSPGLSPSSPDSPGKPQGSPVLLDRHGEPIRHLVSEDFTRSAPVSLSEIPQQLIDCTLAAEDKRFHSHHGIDILATARSAFDFLRNRRIVSGASTITQQLAKISSPPAPRNLLSEIPRGDARPPPGNVLGKRPDPRRILRSPRLRQPPHQPHRSRPLLFPETTRRPLARRVRPPRRPPPGTLPPQSHPQSQQRENPSRNRPRPPRPHREIPDNRHSHSALRKNQPPPPPRAFFRPLAEPSHPILRENPHHPRPHSSERHRTNRPRGNRQAQRLQPPPRRSSRHRKLHRRHPRHGLLRRLGRSPGRQNPRSPHPALARLHPQALHLHPRLPPPRPPPRHRHRRHPHPPPHRARPPAPGKLRPQIPRPRHHTPSPSLFPQRPRPPRTRLPRRPRKTPRPPPRNSASPPSPHPPGTYGLGLTLGNAPVRLLELTNAYATLARGGNFLPTRLFTDQEIPPGKTPHRPHPTPGSSPISSPTKPPAPPPSPPAARSISRSAAP